MNFPPRMSREQEMAEIMGMAMAAGAARSMFPMPRRSTRLEKFYEWRSRALKRLRTSGARLPKPEIMFQEMIADGSSVLIRRRGKPPLLKPLR